MEENRNEEYIETESLENEVEKTETKSEPEAEAVKPTKQASRPRRRHDRRRVIIAACIAGGVLIIALALILLLTGTRECKHSPARAVIENVIESTEDAEGSYDEVVYCKLCDAELSREKKSTNMLAPSIVPTAILMGRSIVDLQIGDTYRITPTVLPANVTDKSLTFTTNRPDVATVDADGTVTAKSVGRAEITATASNGLQASCYVQVTCSPTSHVPGEPAETNFFPATCTDYEHYDIVVCCLHCGLDISSETVYGTELGDHYFEDGECIYCGEGES